MRLEFLCRLSMRYSEASWHRPYASRPGDETAEALGFGHGDGALSGEIDEEREDWWLDVYVCLNEIAHGPPALGAQPPERFRQG